MTVTVPIYPVVSVNGFDIVALSTKYCPSAAGTLVSIRIAEIGAVVIGLIKLPLASLNTSCYPPLTPLDELKGVLTVTI